MNAPPTLCSKTKIPEFHPTKSSPNPFLNGHTGKINLFKMHLKHTGRSAKYHIKRINKRKKRY